MTKLLTRKQFNVIVAAIADTKGEAPDEVRKQFAEALADRLAKYNDQFNRSKFIDACDVQE